MEIIKTKSFSLAVVTTGDKNSNKLSILMPGRLDTKDYWNFESHAKVLAGKGFFVVAFDPPGTWESPGGIELCTVTNYIKAVNELIEYFGNKPTLLVGHSRGGATAALVAASNLLVKGMVLLMASYSASSAPPDEIIARGFNLDYRDLPPGQSKSKEQKEFRLPLNYRKDGEQYNSAQALKNCSTPKLLVYATYDEFRSSETVEDIFRILPEPKMLKKFDCKHDYRYYPEVVAEVNKGIEIFVDKFVN
ncbi:MAG: hypothetical protein A2538_02620 [Candidatus Magasanikbacteria bacterium RIFOXYD2_FULL_41_14]|uniref:AB hydrolase-1 domain-containing protein n=1 Tax=Candidatus Magasanikbacteria bacterium RIFOXYD2_FULL_41_14 TaxID=1798709 RepID=A0A1F6PCG8_9BACT|nr:MAG: hypothetical protein A2538_02620 [Candidatus Magasanikbacteria bacterium RIFOXYD2_FULL_41_14]